MRDYKGNRKLAQQALMWIWHDQWSKHFGDSDKEEHIRFKAEYLLPILLREEVMPGIADLYWHAQRRVKEDADTGPLQAFYKMISTTWLNTKQMAEILTKYQQDTAMLGLVFVTKCPDYEDAFK